MEIFMKKINFVIVILLAAGCLTACQAQPTTVGTPSTDTTNSAGLKPVVDHGTPYSKGPSSAPTMANGPTTPPPADGIITLPDNTQAQAVTTNENIRLTLPRKSN